MSVREYNAVAQGALSQPTTGELIETAAYDCSETTQQERKRVIGEAINAALAKLKEEMSDEPTTGSEWTPLSNAINNQPTIGEWTVVGYGSSFEAIRVKPEGEGCLIGVWPKGEDAPRKLVDAHNAALAAEREQDFTEHVWKFSDDWTDGCIRALEKQLAAERDAKKLAWQEARLAKANLQYADEGYLQQIRQLQQQLAAEKEKHHV